MNDLTATLLQRKDFLFLPLVYRLAARLEQMEWEEFAGDAVSAAYALRSARHAFGLSAIASHFRLGVEAEACGAEVDRDREGEWRAVLRPADAAHLNQSALDRPPLSTSLDLTRRLSEELRGQASVVAVLTGPRTLLPLFDHAPTGLDQFYAVLARAYAERGAAALLVAEREAGTSAVPGVNFNPLANVASYFRLPLVLLDPAREQAAPGFAVTLSEGQGNVLPVDLLRQPPSGAAQWRSRAGPLLATATEVPPDLPAEQLRAWVEALGG